MSVESGPQSNSVEILGWGKLEKRGNFLVSAGLSHDNRGNYDSAGWKAQLLIPTESGGVFSISEGGSEVFEIYYRGCGKEGSSKCVHHWEKGKELHVSGQEAEDFLKQKKEEAIEKAVQIGKKRIETIKKFVVE